MVKIINADEFKTEISKDTPTVVDFFADWCGPCRMMAPVFEELSKEMAGKVNFVKVDTEADPEIAQDYEIRGIPTLIIFKKGEEITRLVGFRDKQRLKADIEAALR